MAATPTLNSTRTPKPCGVRHPCRPEATPLCESRPGIFGAAEADVRLHPPGWEARLYGRQGCLPLQVYGENQRPANGRDFNP